MRRISKILMAIPFILAVSGCSQKTTKDFLHRTYPRAVIIHEHYDSLAAAEYLLCDDGVVVYVRISRVLIFGIRHSVSLNPTVAQCRMP